MRHIYSFLFLLATPFILIRLWWKGRFSSEYRNRIGERFFLNASKIRQTDVWIHAVSLGEVVAIIPLVEALLIKKRSVLITCMTPTGSQKIQQAFGNRVMHQYIPYDLPWIMKRFFRTIRPRVGLIVETELWPNMIYHANKAQVSLLLINARISDKSMPQYMKIRGFLKKLFIHFQGILTQSEEDSKKFIRLGAPEPVVDCLGNIKFDMADSTEAPEIFQEIKKQWGEKRTVLIAASTHANEEAQLMQSFPLLQKAIPDAILLIAPRHPERFQEVYQLAVSMGFNTGLRSRMHTLSLENSLVILDSLGELMHFFDISDYAFIGGSLVSVGGHNVLQAIACEIPVFSGKYVQNFREIYEALENVSGVILVDDADSLMNEVIEIHQQLDRKIQMVTMATQVLRENRGAIDRYLNKIEGYL